MTTRTVPLAQRAPFDAPAPDAPSRELTLRELRGVLARRWLVVVAMTTMCVAASLAVYALVPTTYTATTTVQVTSPTSFVRETSSGTLAAEIATELALLNGPGGAEVLPAGGSDPATDDAIADGLEVGNPEGTALVELAVTATSPELAAEAANAAAERYLMMRTERAEQAREAYLEALGEAAASEATRDRRLDATVYGSEVGTIVRDAEAPVEASSIGLAAYLVAGVLAGLLLGALVALLRERRDPKVRTADRLTDALGAPALLTDDLRSADIGREVGALALAASGAGPVRVGVVVPGGTSVVATLRIVDGLRAAGVGAPTAPGRGPRVELVPLPDPAAAGDDEGTWWTVAAVVVVCQKSTSMTKATRCAQAAAGTRARVLGVLSDNRAEARSMEVEAR